MFKVAENKILTSTSKLYLCSVLDTEKWLKRNLNYTTTYNKDTGCRFKVAIYYKLQLSGKSNKKRTKKYIRYFSK